MKSKKKFVLAGLFLLAAIITGLTLTGCETEVDPSTPQQEQPDGNTGNSGGGNTQQPGGDSTGDNTSGDGNTGSGEEKPGSGENDADSKPCSHQPGADDGDCTTEVKCTVCGEVAVAAKSHDFSGGWQKDAENHWHNCKNGGCNKTNMIAAHTGGTATCVKGKLCETCGHEYSDVDASAHLWGVPEYTLNEDKTQCTATVSCQHDNNHKETKTVEATPKDGQPDVYTVKFSNPLFSITEFDMNIEGPGVTAGSWGGTNDGGGLETE